ncbi:MAG TPA: orotidine-5'-phosphate decarboxylase, partial [Gemmatimonadales bacterium]|nr:orotidine-5'-phosphate decarboxylase [Gemmatimonadales bacterium]
MAEIIIALDLPANDARRLLDRIPSARWVKVGSILFTREGPALVRELQQRGLQVFLDLKWHDIPHTVSEAVAAARELGVAMATVHTLGGAAMMAGAANEAGPDLGIVGVTVLTSHSPESFAEVVGRGTPELMPEVERLAGLAKSSGLRGVVCSPLEIARVRNTWGMGGWIVVPGIRRPGDAAGDQVRTAGPAEAVRAGATHLVVGRPILQAPDPAVAYREMADAAS